MFSCRTDYAAKGGIFLSSSKNGANGFSLLFTTGCMIFSSSTNRRSTLARPLLLRLFPQCPDVEKRWLQRTGYRGFYLYLPQPDTFCLFLTGSNHDYSLIVKAIYACVARIRYFPRQVRSTHQSVGSVAVSKASRFSAWLPLVSIHWRRSAARLSASSISSRASALAASW